MSKRASLVPTLFIACRERLAASAAESFVVGDAVWDLLAAKRAGMLAVGLTSGGISADALREAGAYRVYRGPDELLEHLSDLGF